MKKLILTILIAIALSNSSCVYKANVQQGNVIEQKEVNKIAIGMSKEQIAFILGKPVINTNLVSNVWYYIYYLLPSKGETIKKRLVLTFDNNKLSKIEGTIKPEVEEG